MHKVIIGLIFALAVVSFIAGWVCYKSYDDKNDFTVMNPRVYDTSTGPLFNNPKYARRRNKDGIDQHLFVDPAYGPSSDALTGVRPIPVAMMPGSDPSMWGIGGPGSDSVNVKVGSKPLMNEGMTNIWGDKEDCGCGSKKV